MIASFPSFHYGDVCACCDGGVPVRLQLLLYPLVLGEHHQPRSIAVQAMEHEYLITRVRLLDIFAEQVESGPFLHARAGNRKQAFFLVHDYQVVIFPNNREQRIVELDFPPFVTD